MKRPDYRNVILFVMYPLCAVLMALLVSIVMLAAWPFALFVDLDKKTETTQADKAEGEK